MPEKLDYQQIKGKPHFGLLFGTYLIIPPLEHKDFTKDPFYEKYSQILLYSSNVKHLEMRNITYIYRPQYCSMPFNQSATFAIKYERWGRAYMVMKTCKQKNPPKRYRKAWVNGKRKRIRFL